MLNILRMGTVHPDTAHAWLKKYAPSYLLSGQEVEEPEELCRNCGMGVCNEQCGPRG
jgi:hypothetical protein